MINLMLPLLFLTELHPPFISQTLRDGTPQVQTSVIPKDTKGNCALCLTQDLRSVLAFKGLPTTGRGSPRGSG